jgi:hypothetical protein
MRNGDGGGRSQRDLSKHVTILISVMATVLSPVAGFCIKSSTLQPSVYASHSVPAGHKVFINIAWDTNVPAPPNSSEEVIQRALKGEDIDQFNPDGWYVPVVVSPGRQDKDKGPFPATLIAPSDHFVLSAVSFDLHIIR